MWLAITLFQDSLMSRTTICELLSTRNGARNMYVRWLKAWVQIMKKAWVIVGPLQCANAFRDPDRQIDHVQKVTSKQSKVIIYELLHKGQFKGEWNETQQSPIVTYYSTTPHQFAEHDATCSNKTAWVPKLESCHDLDTVLGMYRVYIYIYISCCT